MDKTMWQIIVSKIFSGRFLVTVSIIGTYCFIIIKCVNLISEKTMQLETFLGLFTAFALIAREIVVSYFERSDRTPEKPIKEGEVK